MWEHLHGYFVRLGGFLGCRQESGIQSKMESRQMSMIPCSPTEMFKGAHTTVHDWHRTNEKLNVDGSRTLVSGSTVPTYRTHDVLGFNPLGVRSNTEQQRTNSFDPASTGGQTVRTYPKPDLHGRFLGDCLLYCESLPPLSWLSAGA